TKDPRPQGRRGCGQAPCGTWCRMPRVGPLSRATTGRGRVARKGELRMGTILRIMLVLLLIGALPTWPYSSGWGYYPSGGLGLVLLVILILALTGRLLPA